MDESIVDSNGHASNAIFGFSEFLYDIISQYRPTYIACAFDVSQTDSYRKQLYPEYKGNRTEKPEALQRQFETCRHFCQAAGIPAYYSHRYEADDVIGTLAHTMRQRGFRVVIISADKDLAQLVHKDDIWWDYARQNRLDYNGVTKHFGIAAESIADMLALAGDKVDNIPGIPGVGYTLAARVLKKFPSINAILNNLDGVAKMKFKGAARIAKLIEEHKDMLPLNYQLTKIVETAEFEGPQSDLRWHGIDTPYMQQLLSQLDAAESRQKRWMAIDQYAWHD